MLGEPTGLLWNCFWPNQWITWDYTAQHEHFYLTRVKHPGLRKLIGYSYEIGVKRLTNTQTPSLTRGEGLKSDPDRVPDHFLTHFSFNKLDICTLYKLYNGTGKYQESRFDQWFPSQTSFDLYSPIRKREAKRVRVCVHVCARAFGLQLEAGYGLLLHQRWVVLQSCWILSVAPSKFKWKCFYYLEILRFQLFLISIELNKVFWKRNCRNLTNQKQRTRVEKR